MPPKSEVPMPMVAAPPPTVAVEDEVPSPCIELPVGEPVQPVAILRKRVMIRSAIHWRHASMR